MQKDNPPLRPAAVKALVVIQAIFAFVGMMSAYGMLASPSGEGMGLEHLRDDLPVDDFTLVGLFFLAFYGILPALAAYGLWTRKRWRWTEPINKWTGQHWSWTATAALGIVLILWIIAEVYFLGILEGIGGALQAGMSILGVLLLAMVMLPSVKSATKPQD